MSKPTYASQVSRKKYDSKKEDIVYNQDDDQKTENQVEIQEEDKKSVAEVVVKDNNSRKRICKYFNMPSGCNNGDNCGFEHTKIESKQNKDKGQVKLCEYSRHGPCPNIKTCDDFHPSILCKFFKEKGQCIHFPEKQECRYRHYQTRKEREELD